MPDAFVMTGELPSCQGKTRPLLSVGLGIFMSSSRSLQNRPVNMYIFTYTHVNEINGPFLQQEFLPDYSDFSGLWIVLFLKSVSQYIFK